MNPIFVRPDSVPLITIVIPTFNWSNVLRIAVASALAQTYPRFEVVVVGDGCTDDSEEVVRAFADERVRWHNLPTNSGSQSAPNNAGIQLARGEYVAYHGHDDVWLPTHLAVVAQALFRENADLAYSVTEEVGPKGSRYRALRGVSWSNRYTPGEWVPPSSIIHRKSLVDRIGPWRDYRTIQEMPDREFVFRAHESGMRLVGVKALTVFKFNSAYRPNSYVEKPSHEQARYLRRIATERGFVYRELASVAPVLLRSIFRSTTGRLPRLPPPPETLPPGWHVTQYRRIRGLEPGEGTATAAPTQP